ncbi:MAG: hypothetical protein HYT07_00800 [Candidatus Levybacteria bacterium]|nr:hypothetical protein [Candidatus Levybacteria bacterium]
MEKQNLRAFLIKIWPAIYRNINISFYFILTTIKSMVSIALKQIKG